MNILYLDEHLAVAVKPAGVLSQEDEKNRANMPALLSREIGGPIFPVHRLDRETAGVMVFARTSKAAAALSEGFALGKTRKDYLAVTTGILSEKEGELEDLLFFDRSKNKVFPVKRERKGVKKALLSYQVIEEVKEYSLVSVQPKTGRTHQIRVQFASRKHPLYGDRKYSGKGEELGLFCTKIRFSHPHSGEEMTFSALPENNAPWNLFKKMKS